jgi:hypothetical protein
MSDSTKNRREFLLLLSGAVAVGAAGCGDLVVHRVEFVLFNRQLEVQRYQ